MVKYATASTCKCREYCVNSYLQNQKLEHEEKQENECLGLLRNNNLLYKTLLHSSWEEGLDKLINRPLLLPKPLSRSDPPALCSAVCPDTVRVLSTQSSQHLMQFSRTWGKRSADRFPWDLNGDGYESCSLGLQMVPGQPWAPDPKCQRCMPVCVCVCVCPRSAGSSKVESPEPSFLYSVSGWRRKTEGLEDSRGPQVQCPGRLRGLST